MVWDEGMIDFVSIEEISEAGAKVVAWLEREKIMNFSTISYGLHTRFLELLALERASAWHMYPHSNMDPLCGLIGIGIK